MNENKKYIEIVDDDDGFAGSVGSPRAIGFDVHSYVSAEDFLAEPLNLRPTCPEGVSRQSIPS